MLTHTRYYTSYYTSSSLPPRPHIPNRGREEKEQQCRLVHSTNDNPHYCASPNGNLVKKQATVVIRYLITDGIQLVDTQLGAGERYISLFIAT